MAAHSHQPEDPGEITRVLMDLRRGDRTAIARLFPLVDRYLRTAAETHLRHRRGDPLLQPTLLVDETYWRLVGEAAIDWRDRAHFRRLAGRAMRRILIDWARRANRAKRGGTGCERSLTAAIAVPELGPCETLEVTEVLEQLAAANPRWARVVELRVFAGASVEEAAHVLGVSERTVYVDWQFARAWLHRRLSPA